MKFIKLLLILSVSCIILGVSTIIGFYFYLKPQLPNVATLKNVELQTPMQVYSSDNKLIAQFGEKRRIPLKLEDMPKDLLNAIIATEDSRFYTHNGIDPIGISRAIFVMVSSGSARQGASTITQQLARNFFLSNERKLMRKIKEMFIAFHIEQLLSKDEILELYLNKIYLGHRSYGVGAAAQVYFGKELKELNLGELALIAGLPKAPSTMNPIYSIDRAITRRNVVLTRMLDEGYISRRTYESAKKELLMGKSYGTEIEVNAPYVAEIARAWMVNKYGEEAYTSGMRVFTTIDSKLQQAAQEGAIKNLLTYDERHGYRGAERQVWPKGAPIPPESKLKLHLQNQPTYGKLHPAIVIGVEKMTAQVYIKNQGYSELSWDAMKWARRFLTDDKQGPAPKKATDILTVGEQIWVRPLTETKQETVNRTTKEMIVKYQYTWKLSQVPNANTAFVAVAPETGAVLSLVGGFNFVHSKFNRATQSVRQVGSAIKPFIYSAAIDKGMTLATLINDAPINTWDASGGTAWRPKNSPPIYAGPTRMRIGLAQSKNVMAIRALREVGLEETRDFLTRFGFEKKELPYSETIALGAGSLTPIQLAQGYSVFVNGGYYIEPYYVSRVESSIGELKYQATPSIVCNKNCKDNFNRIENNNMVGGEIDVTNHTQYAPQVISKQNAFLVREMLYSNIQGGGSWSKGTGWSGTGFRARVLKRKDIGGKTGTTNDSKDAWYSGYGPGIVATVWVGFDSHKRKLGRTSENDNLKKHEQAPGGEAGAKTSQQAWIDFMKVALAETPIENKIVPPDIIRVRIDRNSGLLTKKSDETTVFEYFKYGTEPTDFVKETNINELDLFSSSATSAEETLF